MPNFSDFYFESSTGKNRIRARKCTPDGEAKAVVQIAHGIAEHIERYDDFMSFLSENGFIVVGNDHLGHGKSINSDSDLGFFSENDGWNYVVRDMAKLHDIISEEYPGLKHIMFGHSMGSFLTRTYIINYPSKYDFVILSGTGHQNPVIVNGGFIMAAMMVKTYGPKATGTKLNDIAFGSYNNKISNPRTCFDWLSRANDHVDKYIDDPLCGFVAKNSLYRDMMSGIKYITNPGNISKMDCSKPVYFMSGAEDPVGDYGKGVEKAYNAFCKAGCRDVKIKLYQGGRHEMLNEINRNEVKADILEWIKSKL